MSAEARQQAHLDAEEDGEYALSDSQILDRIDSVLQDLGDDPTLEDFQEAFGLISIWLEGEGRVVGN